MGSEATLISAAIISIESLWPESTTTAEAAATTTWTIVERWTLMTVTVAIKGSLVVTIRR